MESDSAVFEPLQLSHSVIDHWEKNCVGPEHVEEKITDLERLIQFYTAKSTFPELHNDLIERYASLVSKCELEASSQVQVKEVELMKILLRDKNRGHDTDAFAQLAVALFTLSGINVTASAYGNENQAAPINKEVLLEAEKCLINLLFNSASARQAFRESQVRATLPARISALTAHYAATLSGATSYFKPYSDLIKAIPAEQELATLHYLDLKMAFITSAKDGVIQKAWLEDSAGGVMVFLAALQQSGQEYLLFMEEAPLMRANEALQTLFNIYCHAKHHDQAAAEACADECVRIIENRKYSFDLHQNAVHLLSLLGGKLMEKYCPLVRLSEDEAKSMDPKQINEGRDMRFVKALLDVFERGIDENQGQPRLLGTYFSILCSLCTDIKAARRYCRLRIIPPLTAEEVARPPEEGDALRNKLVRLIKENSGVQELAAEFLFVLCKRSVNRLIKYCGLGHSAGLLANYGFLARAMAVGKRSASDSEDSETEDYREVEERVNPVTGYIPPPGQAEAFQRMMEAMSEEQKEFEAMKLVNAMSKLMDAGIITPARVDEQTGQPRPVEHVLELMEKATEEKSNKMGGNEKKEEDSDDD